MALKSLLTFAVVLSILCTAAVGAVVGGWQPIKNPNDPAVVEIAKFAVASYNYQRRTQEPLFLVSVEIGDTKLEDAGTQYRLVLSIKYLGKPYKYLAIVLDKPQEKLKKLIQFIPINN